VTMTERNPAWRICLRGTALPPPQPPRPYRLCFRTPLSCCPLTLPVTSAMGVGAAGKHGWTDGGTGERVAEKRGTTEGDSAGMAFCRFLRQGLRGGFRESGSQSGFKYDMSNAVSL
jgi:hypothetical protein